MIEGATCQCKKTIIPFRELCPACGKAMKMMDFEDMGYILTYTTLHTAPEGFQGPIRLAVVELRAGAHIVCSVKGDREMTIGDEVKVKKDGELYVCEHLE